MEASLRLFIAVELTGAVREVLHEAQTALRAQPLHVRWVDPAGAHVTLKFLGTAQQEQVQPIVDGMARAAQFHRPFTLTASGLGVFPSPRAPRVVWLGLKGGTAELRALQADVERFVAPLGFPTERRPFNPHLTLGRTMNNPTPAQHAAIGAAVTGGHPPRPVTWPVAEISLMRSELAPGGARYTRLAAVELGI